MSPLGEYWIESARTVQFADGDIDDDNHESLAIRAARHEIAERLGVDFDESSSDWHEWMADYYANEVGEDSGSSVAEDYIEAKLKKWGLPGLMDAACDRGDVRHYAERVWGWKRVHGKYVESWTLTPRDLEVIASGISQILDEEGHYDYNDEEVELLLSTPKGGGGNIRTTLAQVRIGELTGARADSPLGRNAQVAAMDKATQHPYYQNRHECTPQDFVRLLS